ncbi:cystathionine beta-synthase [Lichtheimia corymbifera JMRC:FSU:9682]|uniref:Cystathionine beta-synthase n=1 Tax=Lichtheimia corymbifera JMRC:FSU:9682 TaxID=1263082 RepID=A0A068S7Q3_9FUNG|nr:cystathionine beta-synthase [Lichtheimia corymbifera JMRC:FSU:9682]
MPLDRQPPPIADSIATHVGLTPMVRLSPHNQVQLLAKLELANPTGSHKDRVAHKIVKDLAKIDTLIIPTSGNLGIAVAAAAAKTHRVIVVVPEKTSIDRIQMLKALGAEIMRSPTEARPDAPESAFSVATKLKEQLPNSRVIEETKLEGIYYDELAEEIMQQTQMRLDHLFVGVESGLMITQLATALKAKIPELQVFGVDPTDSVLAAGSIEHGRTDWKIEDLGSNFVPKSLDRSKVDGWFKVSDKDAFSTARRLIRGDGIFCGPSSGAVVAAAIQHATTLSQHTTHEYRSVVILNDTAKNYGSTLLNDDWLLENNLADDVMTQELEFLSTDRYRAASVEDLQLPAAVTIPPTATVSYALDLMLEREFSQLPVIRTDNKKLVGYVSLTTLQERLDQGVIQPKTAVQDCMFTFKKATGTLKYQLITPDTSLADLAKFFEKNSFAMVTDVNRKWCLGVATKYDLLSFLHRRQFL